MRQKEECNEDWRPGLNAFLCSHQAPAWTRGRGLLWGVARLGSHWLPGGSARRIKPWSVLPTFYSPRTQTQSTPLARSVQLLLRRVCGPKIDSQGQPEQRTGEGERDWGSSSSSLRCSDL